MKLKFSEIIEALNAEILKKDAGMQDAEYSFSTDTRTIQSGDIYIPLKGENFDGADFILDALKAGAAGYITPDKSIIYKDAGIILYAPDSKEAYLKLARFYKRKINPYTIAVTGSSGKTTVKEMLYSVFKRAGSTVKSILNHNNEIGLCNTLSSLEKDTKYLIAEMGMRGAGEIRLLSKYAEPDTGIITNAGSAHIGRLGSLLNIARAKFEISEYIKKGGVLIAHDNELIRQINDDKHKTIYFSLKDAEIINMTAASSEFKYKGNKYILNAPGEHNVQNALAVIEAGLSAGLEPDLIRKGLEEFKPAEKRWEMQTAGGFNIINDCYNSNPESVKAALKTFLELTPAPKAAVLGDMGELGLNEEAFHIETGRFLEQFSCEYILTLGALAALIEPKNIKTAHFQDKKALVSFMKENLPAGCNILLKASRFMKFEEIIEEIKK